MIELVESWIDELNEAYKPYRQSCSVFQHQFDGFYGPELLRSSYFVVVKALPMPKMPELREAGLGDFLDNGDQLGGITYKNTYYLVPNGAKDLGIHFHELVHVIQWRSLGPRRFIQRYINEMQKFGYSEKAPLESMAYGLQERFENAFRPFDVEKEVVATL
ncbi:hypothetical protein [Marinobacter sp. S6332]|uniref:hypothetical protein n=1 Tax=Marinobacter sp. S6332 TaxID=2926403 RepID=UPI001FF689B0|nr:hypothetical protein [Marinobacter sp. S6332]MCK0164943.1 hypothetical protein [Marinobacter sp. S6332]